MLLAEMGADVLKIDRIQESDLGVKMSANFTDRSRRSIAIDLKKADGIELVLRLCEDADILIEGFRPGVMERLGIGPADCAKRNPRLVFGRVTGWGQSGPLSQAAGHDLNYIALTGALAAIGRSGQPPTPPLNLVGDYGGGTLYLALGVVAALFEARQSGKGQVVDAAMIDGAGEMRRLWHITLPAIAPTIVLMLILQLGSFVKVNFDAVFNLQNAMVLDTAEVIDTFVYRHGVMLGRYSYAAAVGFVQSVISFGLVYGGIRLSKRYTEYEII